MTSMYMFSCSSRTDSTASSWDGGGGVAGGWGEEPFPRGRAPLPGYAGLSAGGALGEAGSHKLGWNRGTECGPAPGALPA